MSRQVSAGLVAWRRGPAGPEVLLVHPGGPYWRGKDAAAWSIPKGLVEPDEDLLAAARREFAEELGLSVEGAFAPLEPRRLPGGKLVHAWLVEADLDLADLRSNLFEMEWPPKSGRRASFPEVGAARWMTLDEAREMILPSQLPLLDRLIERVGQG